MFRDIKSPKKWVIDSAEITGDAFQMVDSSGRAILVKKHGPPGAVRVFRKGNSVTNAVTGAPEHGFVIVIAHPQEECMLLGTPLVRYFRPGG